MDNWVGSLRNERYVYLLISILAHVIGLYPINKTFKTNFNLEIDPDYGGTITHQAYNAIPTFEILQIYNYKYKLGHYFQFVRGLIKIAFVEIKAWYL